MGDDLFAGIDFFPDGILRGLGNIVVLWSSVEAEAGKAILSLGDLGDSDAARRIVAHMDARERIAALKAISFRALRPPHFEEAERWLNHIDADLRSYRNRLIHDEWEADDFDALLGDLSATRIDKRSKVLREPPSGKRVLQVRKSTRVSGEDLAAFCRDLYDAQHALITIRTYDPNDGFRRALPALAWRHKSAPLFPTSDQAPDQIP